MMCYQELFDNLPEVMQKQTYLQIVPLHAILSASVMQTDAQVTTDSFHTIMGEMCVRLRLPCFRR